MEFVDSTRLYSIVNYTPTMGYASKKSCLNFLDAYCMIFNHGCLKMGMARLDHTRLPPSAQNYVLRICSFSVSLGA